VEFWAGLTGQNVVSIIKPIQYSLAAPLDRQGGSHHCETHGRHPCSASAPPIVEAMLALCHGPRASAPGANADVRDA
jgi:hypothetical protein